MNNVQPKFFYDEENHMAKCVINYKGAGIVGVATCAPADYDFESYRTGYSIAEARALIKLLQVFKNCELRPSLQALKHALSCMTMGKSYNENSYEIKTLRREIHNLEKELATTQQEIANYKKDLKNYIDMKDEFYKKHRQDKIEQSE